MWVCVLENLLCHCSRNLNGHGHLRPYLTPLNEELCIKGKREMLSFESLNICKISLLNNNLISK